MISAADLEAARKLDATVRADDDNELAALPSVASVLAFLATQARAEGQDEADHVELAVRLSSMPPGEVRTAAGILAAMGYTAVSERLAQIAGRRHRSLKPLL